MKEIVHTASLLAYLEPYDKNFYLKLSLLVQDNSDLEKSIFPFLIISESDPIAQLIEAQIVSDAGSEVKRIFLLAQRDQCLVKKDELWPLNNVDVNDSWQKAFSFYAKQREDGSFILLSDQIGKKGELISFLSLFYCKTKKVFFHPPCPKCGFPLQQCEDDTLLKSSGLQPFSSSLKRYLFCPECSSPGSLNFYVHELEQSDPPDIKDRWALIKEFGLLWEVNRDTTAFPCNDCQFHQECYGSDNLVITRIVPFSFYPFYMFAFEAMSLNGLDFISLLSGATFEEVEALLESKRDLGRINCLKAVKQNCKGGTPFLFNHDARYFLEVLYLKLSFLAEVFQYLQCGGSLFRHPDLRLSADQIWIKILGQGGLLPFFWNFKAGFMDISRHHAVPQLFQKPAADSLFFRGLFWFYTLLVNRQQKMEDISTALGKMIYSEDNVSFEKVVNETIFLPVNIFWEPHGKNIDNDWNTLWERSINLGWSLLKVSFQNDAVWNEREFQEELENLRRDVKEKLFQRKGSYSISDIPLEDKTVNTVEDKAIHGILMGILKRWQPSVQEKEEEFRKTVIISPQKFEKGITSPTTIPSREVEKQEELQETVILSVKDLAPKSPFPQIKGIPGGMISETVIISPEGTVQPEKDAEKPEEPQEKNKPEEDFLTETVILKPGNKGKNDSKK